MTDPNYTPFDTAEFDEKYWTVNDVLDAIEAARNRERDLKPGDQRLGHAIGVSTVLTELPQPHDPDDTTDDD